MTRTKERKTKGGQNEAPGLTKTHDERGVKARGQSTSDTLGLAISGMTRKPKPRAAPAVDEILWADARTKAGSEMKHEFQITTTLEEYYESMCRVGKTLIATELQRRTQRLYDYKATKQMSRSKN